MTHRTWMAIVLLVLAAAFGCGGGKTTTEETPAGESVPPAEQTAESQLGEAAEQATGEAAQPASQARPAARPSAPAGAPAPAAEKAAAPSEGATAAAAPTAPAKEMLTLPVGKRIKVELDAPLSTLTCKVGDTFTATVSKAVHLQEGTVVAVKQGGAKVEGTVAMVEAAKRTKGTARLEIKFENLLLQDGTRIPITASLVSEAEKTTKRDAATIAGGAAAGAVLGRIIGKDGKDAVIGAVAGAAIGTGVVLATKGHEVELAAGTELSLQLEREISVPAP